MSDGNAKMSHIKSEQGGSVVCRLQSHWLYYVLCGLALALAVSEFLIWLNPEGAGRHLLNVAAALDVALAQMGVGGDDSWGSLVHPEYHIDVTKPLEFTFRFKGI